MLKKVCVLLVLLVAFLSAFIFPANDAENTDTARQNGWVDSVFNELSDDQRIAQLITVAGYSNRSESHYQEIESLVRTYNIGGICFFQGDPISQAKLTNRYQLAAATPIMISMDLEYGLGMRLDSTIGYPNQMTLGALRDESPVYKMGAEVARQCEELGVHVNFAPVVDINSNRENPVINYRSFGENKYKVARLAGAYMRGLQDNGIIATAKHFPGHGDTNSDSHLTLPVIRSSRQRLDSLELYPFRELFDEGIMSVMVAHLYIPSLDATPNQASTLSPKIIKGLLKEELGFDGLVFSDALNMKGVAKYFKPGEVALKALQAGNDVLLLVEDVPDAIKKIKTGLRRGTVNRKEFNKSVKKVLAAKYWAGLHRPYKLIETQGLLERLNTPEAYLLKQKLLEESITLVRDRNNFLPVTHLDTLTFASLTVGGDEENIFQETLGKYAPFTHYHMKKGGDDMEAYTSLFEQLSQYETVVVGLRDMRNSRRQNYGLDSADIFFLRQLGKETKVILATFGNPYALEQFDTFDHLICAYEDNPYTLSIVPQVIFGALPARGVLPVTASEYAEVNQGQMTDPIGRIGFSMPEDAGMNSAVLKNIDHIVEEGIEMGAMPGCQIVIIRNGKVVHQKAYGHLTYERLNPVTNATVYDLASITKVAGTLQAMMFLHGRDRLDTDKKLSHYLPELKKTNKRNTRLRDVLIHQAGLQPYIPYWKETVDNFGPKPGFYSIYPNERFPKAVSNGIYASTSLEDSVYEWTIKSDLLPKDRKTKSYTYRYSDLGYYMMKKIVERELNQPMESFLEQNFYNPLGLSTLTYQPLCKMPVERIAPTENDTYFRNTLVRGFVHDQGAAMIGGVAGHAGLFSNAMDLAILMQMNLQGGMYGGVNYLSGATIEEFSKKQKEDNRRGLGWDKPNLETDDGPTGRYASPATFGHTGFTGTAAWADPQHGLIYVFLSNRIYPDATNTKLIKENIRTRIQDVIYESMMSYEMLRENNVQ
ncbi:glycoside hydrolase family 3 N-terminal domain-containing protein [Roseivirga sp. BDSF3-8]|uniref:glycoside hydrolase family 3 N-terminal domain-containing protein n=1 Tax=Roseivirga sp. BDSF3-8 TaxID=3241598 RepID=UPI0035319288